MRTRLAILVVVVIAAVAVIVTHPFSSSSGAQGTSGSLPPDHSSYLGVYETGPPQTYRPVADFTRMADRQPNLVGYYSGWNEPFKASFAKTVHKYGAATIVQIDPTLISVSAIAAGDYDRYLRLFAASVRAFRYPVVIGFGHEMNANWYSWGYEQTAPATFVAAWRHIVRLFRSRGADNVVWLWTLQADEPGTGPIASWWPGARYVNWVGIDGYYYRPYENFAGIFGKTIAEVRAFTGQPILLSETAVGPVAGQTAKIPDLFAGLHQYGLLGLVWFDIAQNDGLYHQDWHIQDSPAAEMAFRNSASRLTLRRP
jgi:hypothetical protein